MKPKSQHKFEQMANRWGLFHVMLLFAQCAGRVYPDNENLRVLFRLLIEELDRCERPDPDSLSRPKNHASSGNDGATGANGATQQASGNRA